ncbi:thioester-containing protein 1 allele S1-like isoform X2 [Wyeomyia smithii]|nr:thioester-containing protein 1 allele S1-like isoform X2 [Wyeomyia smithii]
MLQAGVFQSQLELAHFVALEDWKITALAGEGGKKEKTFIVAEYVLPKHEIKIRCLKLITAKDKFIPLIIDAIYTFGKPIKGTLSVSIEDTNIMTHMEIHGRAFVDIDLPIIELREINVLVSVIDSESKHIFRSNQKFSIFEASHKITLRKSFEKILPETPFRCWISLTDPFGKPLKYPDVVKVTVTHEIPYWLDKSYTIEGKPNEKGMLPLNIETINNTEKLQLKVEYSGEITNFVVHSEAKSEEHEPPFMFAFVLTENLELNQPVQFLVTSSFKIRMIVYFILSHGEIVATKTLKVNRRWTIFEETANYRMVPKASLVVIAVHNNTMIKATANLVVEDLPNFVNLTLSRTKLEPGEELKISAKSHPGSEIGLLAIDKGVLTLADGNDITKGIVFDEFNDDFRSFNQEESGFLMLSDFSSPLKPLLIDSNLFAARLGEDDASETASYIRQNFPESWLWSDMAPVDSNGEIIISSIVPDSITNWQISAFSISSARGLGIIAAPISLDVLKRFFVVVNLAYSILKTEIAVVEVFIFSYLDTDQDTKLTLSNQRKEFYFVDHQNQTSDKLEEIISITIPANNVRKVKFFLKPRSSGELEILVKAETPTATDAVRRSMRVTPGGLQYYRNIARFIEVESSSQNFRQLQLIIPRSATPGSENITFSVEGILIGAALTNLGDLIRLPSGCGEQNMLNLVPSVVVLDYLSNTATLDETTKQKAINYLEKGYQNQLKYKLNDGSFSVFGQSDGKGSVFLTALVAKTFKIASKYITVDAGVINSAYNWLQSRQSPDGQYKELGKIHHQNIQGGLSGGVTLTAYTITAFLEQKNLKHRYKTEIEKGADFIAERVRNLSRSYDLALAAYALQLVGHSGKRYPLDKLLEQSKINPERTMRWWDDGSASIETASYVLLTMMSAGLSVDAMPIMRWLISQRYDKGGYDNTQNTFVGLKALAEYSYKLSVSRNNYTVELSYGDNQRQNIQVDAKSSVKSQLRTLPANVRSVDVSITGTGSGVFQIAYQYNQIAADDKPRFEIVNDVHTKSSGNDLQLAICAHYTPLHRDEVLTNMVLIEILFPSGYVLADETRTNLDTVKKVRKFEEKRDGTLLVLYFDAFLPEELVCVNVTGFRKALVLGQIAGRTKIYDYYDPTREAIEYFNVENVDLENEVEH